MPTLLAQQTSLAGAALFYLFAALVGVSAIGVALSRNIVRMAVLLLFTLIGVAGLYFLLSAEFLAAVQLVVYAGGTLILLVFGVMLTSRTAAMLLKPKPVEVAAALVIGGLLLASLVAGILTAKLPSDAMNTGGLYPMDGLGQALLGDYLVPFEIISVLLLVVMIGAAYLAKARKRASH